MGNAVIWKGRYAKFLPATGLEFKSGETIFPFSGNPNGVETAEKGSVILDTTNSKIWINTDGATTWVTDDNSNVTLMPTGFPNRTDTSLSASGFSAGAGGTVTLNDVGGGFRVFSKGKFADYTGNETFTIPAVTDLYYLYFDTSFAKQTTAVEWDIEDAEALTAILYYNNATGDYFLGEERHGAGRNLQWHDYAHHTIGARYRSGFGAIGYTLVSDTLTDIQIALSSGVFNDEDIENAVSSKAKADNWDKWYREGVAGPWRKTASTDTIPAFHSGNVPKINQDTGGGVWGLVDVVDMNFFNVYILATNSAESTNRFIIIPGQNQYGSLNDAINLEGANTLVLGHLPAAELSVIYKITLWYTTTFGGGNDARVRIGNVQDLRGSSSPGVPAAASNHNSLAGRDTDNAHPTAAINYPAGSGAPISITDLQEFIDYSFSSGVVTGAQIIATDAGVPSVDIDAGEIHLRDADTHTAPLRLFPVDAQTVNLTDNDVNYIYADYNAGSPQYAATTDLTTIPGTNACGVAVAAVVNGAIHHFSFGNAAVDSIGKYAQRRAATNWLQHSSGAILSETGTRNIALTAGAFYVVDELLESSAFDTSGAGSFTGVYSNGAGGWTYDASQTQIDNTKYDDGSGVLASIPSNNYSIRWVWLLLNSSDSLLVQYGDSYTTPASAEAAQVPSSRPPELATFGVGVLVGKIIVREGRSTFYDILSPFNTTFTSSSPTEHNGLSGLQGGTTDEYYHLTEAEHLSVSGQNKTTILDNRSVAVNFGSLVVDPAEYRAFILKGFFVVGSQESYIEVKFVWDGAAWRTKASEDFDIPSGVSFSATAAGQVQYTSDSYGSDGEYSWQIEKFAI